MDMGSELRLRTCMELVEHGVEVIGAPATSKRRTPRPYPSAPCDAWLPVASYLDLDPDPFAGLFTEGRDYPAGAARESM
jgi:hypothetical protein